jgi:alkaline phosphatase D
VLDCRGERRPSTRAGANAQFISPEQLAWLQDGLLASTAIFKFVVTSKPITGRVAMDLARDDFWEGFPAQREKLLKFITDNDIKGLWFLSGDVHYGCICRVERAGPYSRLREVYMGPSGSGDPGIVDCDPGGQDDAIVRRLNYTKFRADPFSKTLDISIIGVSNNVLCHKRFPA